MRSNQLALVQAIARRQERHNAAVARAAAEARRAREDQEDAALVAQGLPPKFRPRREASAAAQRMWAAKVQEDLARPSFFLGLLYGPTG